MTLRPTDNPHYDSADQEWFHGALAREAMDRESEPPDPPDVGRRNERPPTSEREGGRWSLVLSAGLLAVGMLGGGWLASHPHPHPAPTRPDQSVSVEQSQEVSLPQFTEPTAEATGTPPEPERLAPPAAPTRPPSEPAPESEPAPAPTGAAEPEPAPTPDEEPPPEAAPPPEPTEPPDEPGPDDDGDTSAQQRPTPVRDLIDGILGGLGRLLGG